MKTALIAGASGLVGHYLLTQMLAGDEYAQVKLLVRKPLDLEHPRLEQIVFDFDDPQTELIRADDVFCCLGTTIGRAGSRAAFRKVDYDYVLRLAAAARTHACAQFLLVTAMGADPRSKFFYNRVKGEIEQAVDALGFSSFHIFRPSLLLGPRKEFRTGEALAKLMMSFIGFLLPANIRGVHAQKVARAMLLAAREASPGRNLWLSGQIQKM